MKLIKIKEKGVEHSPQKLLIYGAPKTGKTAATAKLIHRLIDEDVIDKVIWLDLEQGYKTLFNPELNIPDYVLEAIELVQIKDTSESPIGITSIMKVFEAKNTLCENHGKLKAKCLDCRKDDTAEFIELDLHSETTRTLVVLETFSQLSASALHHATGNGKTTVDLADLDVEGKATLNHYGMQGRYLEKILTDLQQLRCHVVVTSHEINLQMDDSKEKLTASGGTNNFARKLPKAFDHVIRLFVQNKKHVGISNTTINAAANAGSRLGANVLNEKGEVDLFKCFRVEASSSKPSQVEKSASPASNVKTTAKKAVNFKARGK